MMPEELVALARDVSLAKVVNVTIVPTPYDGRDVSAVYEFEVQEHLFGADEKRFVIYGIRLASKSHELEEQGSLWPSYRKSFIARSTDRFRVAGGVAQSPDHSDAAFWEWGGGRLYNDTACLILPHFTLGETYLVFRGAPLNRRSYEHISTVDGRLNRNDKGAVHECCG